MCGGREPILPMTRGSVVLLYPTHTNRKKKLKKKSKKKNKI
jgi:hypothetical protein